MQVQWIKCESDVWCSLKRLKLSSAEGSGVYIIWNGENSPYVVYVGQGDFQFRFSQHRNNTLITRHGSDQDELFVTWAVIPWDSLDGVERYLADALSPCEGDRHPDVSPIRVNLPW